MSAVTADIWNDVLLKFAERPRELMAVAAVCKHLSALVRDRRCWGRLPFQFPHARNPEELRMMCDWMVVTQLSERWQYADQFLIAGSFALHGVMVRRGPSPSWYPQDIDVWLVNGPRLEELADLVTEKLRTLGPTVDLTPGCGDYVTNDRFDGRGWGWKNQDFKNGPSIFPPQARPKYLRRCEE